MPNLQDSADQDLEKNISPPDRVTIDEPYHLEDKDDRDTALRKIRTAGSISVSPELFEKIYLSPKNKVSNNLRSTVGNPTPLCIVGFILSLTPLSNVLLGWRGSGGSAAAEVGVFFFFGGLLMVIGGILEFILGNTFPFVVFGSFGAFWLSFGATLTPSFNAAAAYQPGETAAAMSNPTFLSTYAFFLVYMSLMCFVFLICSVRTNVVFIGIFTALVITFGCLAGSYWHSAMGHAAIALRVQHVAGGFAFVASLLGWYLFLVQMLASVDFPLSLPVGNTSTLIKGANEKRHVQ